MSELQDTVAEQRALIEKLESSCDELRASAQDTAAQVASLEALVSHIAREARPLVEEAAAAALVSLRGWAVSRSGECHLRCRAVVRGAVPTDPLLTAHNVSMRCPMQDTTGTAVSRAQHLLRGVFSQFAVSKRREASLEASVVALQRRLRTLDEEARYAAELQAQLDAQQAREASVSAADRAAVGDLRMRLAAAEERAMRAAEQMEAVLSAKVRRADALRGEVVVAVLLLLS